MEVFYVTKISGLKASALGDSSCRTCISTGAAVCTCICIDDIMVLALRNSTGRALALTCSAAYTLIRNNICHNIILLKKRFNVSIS